MIHKTRVMLYSMDVAGASDFWLNTVGAVLIETMALPEGFEGKVIALNETNEIAIFPKEFIEKYSPEVADDFDAYYDRIPTRGEIFENSGTRTFNFSTPDGLYFVFAEHK